MRRQSCKSSGSGQHHTLFLLCILLFLTSSMPIAASSTNFLNNNNNNDNNKQRHLPEADCICPENGKCKAKGDEECCEDKDIWKVCKIECVCPKDCDEKKEFCCDWNDKKCQVSIISVYYFLFVLDLLSCCRAIIIYTCFDALSGFVFLCRFNIHYSTGSKLFFYLLCPISTLSTFVRLHLQHSLQQLNHQQSLAHPHSRL